MLINIQDKQVDRIEIGVLSLLIEFGVLSLLIEFGVLSVLINIQDISS